MSAPSWWSAEEYPYPHCNPEVLHAPDTCWACDLYPDKQALRAASGTPFTPAEANGWPGNVAAPTPPRARVQLGTANGRCAQPQPRGWRCQRYVHPYDTPCAAVPRWWNIGARLRYRGIR